MQENLSKKELGERIKDLRVENSFSQAFIADILGLSRSNYSQIEIGNQYPTLNTLHILARYYNKSYDWLLHGYIPYEFEQTPLIKIISYQTILKQPQISVNAAGKNEISLVTNAAKPEYLKNIQSKKFIEQLPTLDLPVNDSDEGNIYRAFIAGNKSLPTPICTGDIIIGKHIDNYNKLIPNNICIIVTLKEIIISRILDVSPSREGLVCRSNSDQSDFILPLGEVQELWEAKGKFTEKLEPLSDDLESNFSRFESILKKMENELLTLRSLKSGIK